MPYVETIDADPNQSIVPFGLDFEGQKLLVRLYPDNVGGPVSVSKALEVLRWSPTTLTKAMRSVARFYEPRLGVITGKWKKLGEHGRFGWHVVPSAMD